MGMETNKHNWSIKEIEALTEEEAQAMALEKVEIKDHNIYLVDFSGDPFGYSCLVFKNNHHIYYANNYELHHKGKTREELKTRYIEGLNNILFTEAEIRQPIKDYDEYSRKSYYLHNYYGMQVDRVSIFCINPSEEEEKAFREKTEDMWYNPVAFAYMADLDFVDHHIELRNTLEEEARKMSNNYDYLKKAFLYEMYNHEYGINWERNFDVLSCFGFITYNDEDDPGKYLEELNFTEVQKKAFYDARRQYFKEANY